MGDGEIPIRPERVLVVGAHPDDAEFFAGGTLVRLQRAGARVSLVVCTDGGRGGRGLEDPTGVRRREQARAAEIVGFHEVVHLDHPDGELAAGERLRRELVREIRRLRPELVLAHDPRTYWASAGERVQLGHSDHRAAGQGTFDAIYPRAPSPNFYADLAEASPGAPLSPWFPRELWLYDSALSDLAIEVGDAFETKLAALRAHASQDGAAGSLVAAARALAAAHATGARPAEAFVRLRLR